MRLYAGIQLAALVALTGVLFGAWWAPFAVCVVLGAVVGRARFVVPVGAGIGLLSWLVPLAGAHARYGLGPTAGSLAAIMGFGHAGAVPTILTLLVGTLLGLTGAWVATAVRSLVMPSVVVDALRNE